MIPAVLTMTMLLPPASPWATASTKALRRANRSPATASVVSAIAAMAPRRNSHVNRALVATMAARGQRAPSAWARRSLHGPEWNTGREPNEVLRRDGAGFGASAVAGNPRAPRSVGGDRLNAEI